MRWTPRGPSPNLEDRRGQSGPRFARAGLGVGGTIVVLVLSLLFGRNLFDTGDGATLDPSAAVTGTVEGGTVAPVEQSPEEARLVQFVSFVLDDVQATWAQLLPSATGTPYRDARLVLFRDAVQSACGSAESASGPFYCPEDERVYLDLGFFDELRSRFGAPGDFAQAYVVAHEIGHHVQKLLGTEARVRALREQRPDEANALSVRLELQADCYAGVWGNSTSQRRLLEQGDVEEGLAAAAAVGDDRIQRSTTGTVNPESFTHGTARERAGWFRRGFTSGNPGSCDTFAGSASTP